ncbi:aspartate/glutamate racemase family protein [Candidatus Woesebacteria bacterium]|nr:aspartate/glutamate racemase family protein [Candidatus Woesebacteria bacterium]
MNTALDPAIIDVCVQLITKLNDRQKQGIRTVGVFDSGVGGLTVLPSLTEPTQLSDILYRGDTAHFPYGEKTETELIPLVLADITYLVESGCSTIGIACNTASVIWQEIVLQLPDSIRQLAAEVILDTISTTVRSLSTIEPHKTIGIIGTSFTVHSGAYERAISRQFPEAQPVILQSAEQVLINAIERGEKEAIDRELLRIFEYFGQCELDVFILGCTHYGHIAPAIAGALSPQVVLLDPSVLLGKKLRQKISSLPSVADTSVTPQTTVTFTGERPATCVY